MKALRDAIDQMLHKQDRYREAQRALTARRREYRESEDVVRTLRGRLAARPARRREGRAA